MDSDLPQLVNAVNPSSEPCAPCERPEEIRCLLVKMLPSLEIK